MNENVYSVRSNFHTWSHLKSHVNTKHRKPTFKCCECGDNFQSNFNLEQHHIVVHKKETHFKCDECNGTLLVNWRLVKHKNINDQNNIRTCHYHNNKSHVLLKSVAANLYMWHQKNVNFTKNCRRATMSIQPLKLLQITSNRKW